MINIRILKLINKINSFIKNNCRKKFIKGIDFINIIGL